MSETATNTVSNETLIRDSQIGGFMAFKERLGSCCCRIFKKSSDYNFSSAQKKIDKENDKPSYANQAYQQEKQDRQKKLEKIAQSLPLENSDGTRRTPISVTRTPIRSTATITQGTPRSGIGLRPPTSTPISKTNISSIKTPLPSKSNPKQNTKDSDETSTDDSTEEESSESDNDNSSDSEKPMPKKTPANRGKSRR